MRFQTEKELKNILAFLEQGNPYEAKKIFDEIRRFDLENEELEFSGKCCNFWIYVLDSLEKATTNFEKGEILLKEWTLFIDTMGSGQYTYKDVIYAINRGIFSIALNFYMNEFSEKEPVHKSGILRKAGLCYKKLGEYENAKKLLTESNALYQFQAATLADLADCYALSGDDKGAKVLFREAFYLDFKRIDIEFLDSQLICRLIEHTRKQGFDKDLLKAWIPVYGVLWGIFHVSRSLKSQEVTKLKQAIYSLENEQKKPSQQTELLVPQLINMYFWLIDFYKTQGETKKINEILLKIKILDTNVYNMYIK